VNLSLINNENCLLYGSYSFLSTWNCVLSRPITFIFKTLTLLRMLLNYLHLIIFRYHIYKTIHLASAWGAQGPCCALTGHKLVLLFSISMSLVGSQGDPCTATILWYIVRPICFIPPLVPYVWQTYCILHNGITS